MPGSLLAQRKSLDNDIQALRERMHRLRAEAVLPGADKDAINGQYEHIKEQVDALQKKKLDLATGRNDMLLGVASSLDDNFVENAADPALHERLGQVAHSLKDRFGSIHLGQAWSREQVLAELNGTGYYGVTTIPEDSPSRTSAVRGIIPAPRRRLRLLDLIPAVPVDNNTVPYLQEGLVLTGGPGPTAEGAVKPSADVTFVEAETSARTLAGWTKIQRQVVDDVAGLLDTVSSRLSYAVLRNLEAMVLNGDGTGQNLQGIMQQTGLGVEVFDAAAYGPDQVLDAITTNMLSDYEPDAVVIHPLAWRDAIKERSAGSGEYLSSGPFGALSSQMWELPVIPSPAIPVGRALVGSFAQGVKLGVKEGINVRVSDSDQDDFLRNRLTVLAEGRWMNMVIAPAAFTVVHLDDTP